MYSLICVFHPPLCIFLISSFFSIILNFLNICYFVQLSIFIYFYSITKSLTPSVKILKLTIYLSFLCENFALKHYSILHYILFSTEEKSAIGLFSDVYFLYFYYLSYLSIAFISQQRTWLKHVIKTRGSDTGLKTLQLFTYHIAYSKKNICLIVYLLNHLASHIHRFLVVYI